MQLGMLNKIDQDLNNSRNNNNEVYKNSLSRYDMIKDELAVNTTKKMNSPNKI